MTAIQFTQVYIEWDEPGAGGICINGDRNIGFSIATDWSDPWNPQVNEAGQQLLDLLPRLVQERENAYATAQRLEQELNALRAESGRSEP